MATWEGPSVLDMHHKIVIINTLWHTPRLAIHLQVINVRSLSTCRPDLVLES
jgi:hypothetical protein